MDPNEDFPAELVDQLTPLGVLGHGAMGRVFLAKDRTLGRRCAVKVTLRLESAQLEERFRREARALAKVRHPNVVEVYSVGEVEVGPYMVMEYLEGQSLDQLASTRERLDDVAALAGALEALHEVGVYHRDVKPTNAMRTVDGRTVLVDFGLAMAQDLTVLTQTGGLVGSFAFLSPEVLQGGPQDEDADWWALAVTCFALLEGGRMPWNRGQLSGVMGEHPLPEPDFQDIPPDSEVARFLRRCFSAFPEDRPREAADWVALARRQDDPLAPGGAAPAPSADRAVTVGAARPCDDRAATVAAARGSGDRRAPGASAPRAAPLAAAVAALALVGLVASGGGRAPSGGPAADPAGVAGGRPGVPAPEAGAASLRTEGQPWQPSDAWAAELLASVEAMPACAESSTRGPCLGPDPLAWGPLRAGLEPLQRLDAFLRGGGRPDLWSPEARRQVQRADSELSALGLGDPLAGLLAAPRNELAVPRRFEKRFAHLGLGPRSEGWVAAVVEAYHRALEELRALDSSPRLEAARRSGLGGLKPFMEDAVGTERTLALLWTTGAGRALAAELTQAGAAWLRRLLQLAGRVEVARPDQAELVGFMVAELIDDLDSLFLAPLASESAATLLAGPAMHPAAQLVLEAVEEELAEIRAVTPGGRDRSDALRREALHRALDAPAFDGAGRARRALAVQRLQGLHLDRGEAAEVEAIYRRAEAEGLLELVSEQRHGNCMALVVRAWQQLGTWPARAEAQRILQWFARHREVWQRNSVGDEGRAALVAMLEDLAARRQGPDLSPEVQALQAGKG